MIPEFSERALIFAPRGRDASVAATMLRETEILTVVCADMSELIAGLCRGAGFAVVTEEALAGADLRELSAWLADQPEWSDFPFVLLTVRGGGLERNPAARRYLETLGNVTFLERPFHPTTLVSLARAAIRGRRRQYDARARLIALRESEERLRLATDNAEVGFWDVDVIDDLLFWPARVKAMFGISPDVPVSMTDFYNGLHPDDRDATSAAFAFASDPAERGLYDVEYRTIGKEDGIVRWVAAKGRGLFDSAGRCVRVVGTAIDITQRKEIELELLELNATLERRVEDAVAEREATTLQLREAQKLETLGQLSGGLAHDMNNLLSPILSTLDMLQRRYDDGDPTLARALDRAIVSAERAKTLVSRMLGFARRQTLEATAVDVARLMDGMRELIASSVGTTIGIETRIAPSLPPVLADANQLELAILNLCINAKDAMPDGGRLVIEAALATAPPQTLPSTPGGYVLLRVSDTGSGMDPATLAKAIEPFFSTKEVGKGTGLGLSMVHGFGNQSGGAFILTSRIGEGTRAELYLPVASTPAVATIPHAPRAPVAAGRTLLLVDDEVLVRMGTTDMLEELGHTVFEASNGAEALELLAAHPEIEAVVTDFTMPQMTGAELARRVRDERGELPILLVTGYAAGDLGLALPQLTKPFRQTDLADALAGLWSAAIEA